MSFEQVEVSRADTTKGIYQKFAESIHAAEIAAASKTHDATLKKLTAARVSLEYAVIATAKEKGINAHQVADALLGASIEQLSMLIKEGRAALGRVYNIEPDVLVNVFAGKLVAVEIPKGFSTNSTVDKIIDTARNLLTGIIQEEYGSRGRFDLANDSFVALKSEGAVAPMKAELATRLAFLESSIDAATQRGEINAPSATLLKERIEYQIFQPRPPLSLEFSKEFITYYEKRGASMRMEAMKEVRAVMQSNTVKDITQKLEQYLSSSSSGGVGQASREHQALER
jgi:hypothetical protein